MDERVRDLVVRPMRPEDVPAVEGLSADSFLVVDQQRLRVTDPAPVRRPPHRRAAWEARTRHLVGTDPAGCWVAEDASGLVGMAVSFVRDTTWVLASYAVRPGLQGLGIGRVLLDAALQHARGCLRGMLSASADPRALRRYHHAGFVLHPQMYLTGTVDRSAIPVLSKVREGSAGDVDLMDSVDRRTRGAAHGPDHGLLLASGRLLVSDTRTSSGYAYVDTQGALVLLAATDRRTAARLLWAVLADAEGETTVGHLTAANHWAVEVGMAARLVLDQEGYLGLRGMRPPAPYVHHGVLL